MDINFEVVSTVLQGILALSASPILCTALFRVLVKDGVPLDGQEFRRNRCSLSFIWRGGGVLLEIFLIFFVGNASMPDRLRETSIAFELNLIIAEPFCFLVILLLRKNLAKTARLLREIPVPFFCSRYHNLDRADREKCKQVKGFLLTSHLAVLGQDHAFSENVSLLGRPLCSLMSRVSSFCC